MERTDEQGETDSEQKRDTQAHLSRVEPFSLPTCLLRTMNSTAAPPSSSRLQFSMALNKDRKNSRQKEKDRVREKTNQQRILAPYMPLHNKQSFDITSIPLQVQKPNLKLKLQQRWSGPRTLARRDQKILLLKMRDILCRCGVLLF